MAFKVGDVVRLKSGGAWMTISALDEHSEVIVTWHNPIAKGGFENKTARYPEAILLSKEEHDRQFSEGMQAATEDLGGGGRRGLW